jgi:hypothetical protein
MEIEQPNIKHPLETGFLNHISDFGLISRDMQSIMESAILQLEYRHALWVFSDHIKKSSKSTIERIYRTWIHKQQKQAAQKEEKLKLKRTIRRASTCELELVDPENPTDSEDLP